ncbi:MAG: hypothetical protein UHY90_07435 [Treponema sp.]|nr:hypothetical protein [Spirochaetia bacterium]MEE1182072.1 hypothetical protein [Treponema sp.]
MATCMERDVLLEIAASYIAKSWKNGSDGNDEKHLKLLDIKKKIMETEYQDIDYKKMCEELRALRS